MKRIDQMDEDELIEHGRQLRNDPTWDGFKIKGRPITNAEMYAMNEFSRVERRRKAEQFLKEEL